MGNSCPTFFVYSRLWWDLDLEDHQSSSQLELQLELLPLLDLHVFLLDLLPDHQVLDQSSSQLQLLLLDLWHLLRCFFSCRYPLVNSFFWRFSPLASSRSSALASRLGVSLSAESSSSTPRLRLSSLAFSVVVPGLGASTRRRRARCCGSDSSLSKARTDRATRATRSERRKVGDILTGKSEEGLSCGVLVLVESRCR